MENPWIDDLDLMIDELRTAVASCPPTTWPDIAKKANLGIHTIEGFARQWKSQQNPTISTLKAVAKVMYAGDHNAV